LQDHRVNKEAIVAEESRSSWKTTGKIRQSVELEQRTTFCEITAKIEEFSQILLVLRYILTTRTRLPHCCCDNSGSDMHGSSVHQALELASLNTCCKNIGKEERWMSAKHPRTSLTTTGTNVNIRGHQTCNPNKRLVRRTLQKTRRGKAEEKENVCFVRAKKELITFESKSFEFGYTLVVRTTTKTAGLRAQYTRPSKRPQTTFAKSLQIRRREGAAIIEIAFVSDDINRIEVDVCYSREDDSNHG
jgi:hypothetical protein